MDSAGKQVSGCSGASPGLPVRKGREAMRENAGRCGGKMERASDPTEAEIRAMCEQYQEKWPEYEFELRRMYCGTELEYRRQSLGRSLRKLPVF